MSQYKIPQKTQREDKIIGPLTARQLLYAFLTITTVYLLYQTVNLNPAIEFSSIEKLILLLPLAVLGAAFTLIEINERPFEIYFAAFLQFLLHPRVRIWQKEIPDLSYSTTTKAEAEKKEQEKSAEPESNTHVSRAEIERLSQIMDAPETVTAVPKSQSSKTQALLNIVENSKENAAPMHVIAKQNSKSLFPSFEFLSSLQGFFFGSGNTDKKKAAAKSAAALQTEASSIVTIAAKEAKVPGQGSPFPAGTTLSAEFANQEQHHAINNDAEDDDLSPPLTPQQSVSKFDIKLPSELSIEELIAQAQVKQNNPQ